MPAFMWLRFSIVVVSPVLRVLGGSIVTTFLCLITYDSLFSQLFPACSFRTSIVTSFLTWSLKAIYCYNVSYKVTYNTIVTTILCLITYDTLLLKLSLHGHLRPSITTFPYAVTYYPLLLQRFLHGHLRPSIVTIFLCMITHDVLFLKHSPVWSLAAIYYNFSLHDHLLPLMVATYPRVVTSSCLCRRTAAVRSWCETMTVSL